AKSQDNVGIARTYTVGPMSTFVCVRPIGLSLPRHESPEYEVWIHMWVQQTRGKISRPCGDIEVLHSGMGEGVLVGGYAVGGPRNYM
ncbi:hypothetical protein KI387_022463, partial [Taxus chinensis]